MVTNRIIQTSENGYFNFTIPDDFEYGNPANFYMNLIMNRVLTQARTINKLEGKPDTEDFFQAITLKGMQTFNEFYNDALTIQVPVDLLSLLDSTDKKEQWKILKNTVMTGELLTGLIFQAYEKGYIFSSYTANHHPTGTDHSKVPEFAYKEEDGVITIANNRGMSEGQVKAIISQQKTVIIKFFDKGDVWHCLYTTYKALNGEETGYSHMHYISSAFTKSREYVLQQLQSKHYVLDGFHVNFDTS